MYITKKMKIFIHKNLFLHPTQIYDKYIYA